MSAALEALIAAHVAVATSRLHGKIRSLASALADLGAAHHDLRDRHERSFRPGVVTDVNASAHTYRQQIGVDENGNVIKSPWRPYSQNAGAFKLHTPPSVGQQMLLISPDGDHEQGVGFPYGWSNANASPSTDGATIAGSFGGVSFSINGSTIAIGGNVTQTGNLTLTGALAASGGAFTHNSKDVGSDHAHSGVQGGGDNSGPPV